MEVWGVLVFLAVALSSVYTDHEVTFPEIARARTPNRISSGWEAREGQFPYTLSLRLTSREFGTLSGCGGTIIHPWWGLTAAHCTATRYVIAIRAGTVNLTRPGMIFEVPRRDRDILLNECAYVNHPLYDESRPSVVQNHDIGLIYFARELVFNELIRPIRLQRSAAKDTDYSGRQLTASGWGRLWTEGPAPENLNWVYLRGISNQECYDLYHDVVADSTICASGYNVTSQSTCQGDSGGPLTVIEEDNGITQIGVTSFSHGDGCQLDFPAGYIRPGHYHDWFYEVTGINFDWDIVPPPTMPPPTTSSTTVPPPIMPPRNMPPPKMTPTVRRTFMPPHIRHDLCRFPL